MSIDEIIEKVRQEASRKDVDLEALGMIGEDEIITYALLFMLKNIEDLEELDIDLELSEISDEIESDYFEDEM